MSQFHSSLRWSKILLCICFTFYIHSPVDGCLGQYQFLGVVHSTVINMGVQICLRYADLDSSESIQERYSWSIRYLSLFVFYCFTNLLLDNFTWICNVFWTYSSPYFLFPSHCNSLGLLLPNKFFLYLCCVCLCMCVWDLLGSLLHEHVGGIIC